MGIIDEIRVAKSESKIDSLLAKLETYKFASSKTKRRALKCADIRRRELNG